MAGEDDIYDSPQLAEPQDTRSPDGAEADPGEKAQIEQWLAKIAAAKKHWKPAFDRMKKSQQIAAHGAYKEWLEDESRYVVPVLNRHVNQSVAQLYARDPQAVASPRKRLLNTVWDGTQEQVQMTTASAMLGDMNAAAQLMAIKQDIANSIVEQNRMDRAAETLTLLYDYFIDEQPYRFKTKLKQVVRRTKVNGVAWLKVNFVRQFEMRPEATAMAEDTVAKMRTIERLTAELASGDCPDYEAKTAELASLQTDVAMQPDRVVREQPIFDYPKSREIILDTKTRDLKTLEGCGWLAHEFCRTAEQIQDIYNVDVRGIMPKETREAHDMMETKGQPREFTIYEVQNKYTQQVFVIGEGLDRYLQRPAERRSWFERFFNVFPLVFNEIEHDEEIYPPSDVWAARHMQFEYNRSREGLREHRIAARPYWLAARGRLEEDEKARLRSHAAHEIVEVMQVDPKAPLEAVVARGPTAPIDPNLYEVEGINMDLLRSVGSQEANLGGLSGATATESSIAESSRMSSLSDNVDDLDDFLTEVAAATGQLLLQEMSKERVVEILGPGAVWPELPLTRKQLADEITLKVKAGSSGRPNQAAKLANMERAWPALSMLPNLNPDPIAEEYADLLDLPFDKMSRQGAMSIVAMNAAANTPPPMPAGSPAPEAQGGRGGERPADPGPAQGPQPAFPAANDSAGLA